MQNGRKRVSGPVAASILLAASALALSPASAGKPPKEPPDDYDKWYYCTPYGPLVDGVDCCDYPELVVPCEDRPVAPVTREEEI